ncbi:hypothetical protein Vretifemale_12746, partial [Volvox reticuliferus]
MPTEVHVGPILSHSSYTSLMTKNNSFLVDELSAKLDFDLIAWWDTLPPDSTDYGEDSDGIENKLGSGAGDEVDSTPPDGYRGETNESKGTGDHYNHADTSNGTSTSTSSTSSDLPVEDSTVVGGSTAGKHSRHLRRLWEDKDVTPASSAASFIPSPHKASSGYQTVAAPLDTSIHSLVSELTLELAGWQGRDLPHYSPPPAWLYSSSSLPFDTGTKTTGVSRYFAAAPKGDNRRGASGGRGGNEKDDEVISSAGGLNDVSVHDRNQGTYMRRKLAQQQQTPVPPAPGVPSASDFTFIAAENKTKALVPNPGSAPSLMLALEALVASMKSQVSQLEWDAQWLWSAANVSLSENAQLNAENAKDTKQMSDLALFLNDG